MVLMPRNDAFIVDLLNISKSEAECGRPLQGTRLLGFFIVSLLTISLIFLMGDWLSACKIVIYLFYNALSIFSGDC